MLNRRRLRRAHARPVNTQPEFTMQEDKVLYVYIWQRGSSSMACYCLSAFFLHEKKINFKD